MHDFEVKVLSELKNIGLEFSPSLKIGAAVSGGADSLSLLFSLASILKSFNLPLYVISINHNIRPKEETLGDALYVKEVCSKLEEGGVQVFFHLEEFERGLVEKTSVCRKGGEEEAARFLRYQAFENFIKENNLDFLCLAHNKNDQVETMLMRFLKGASVEALAGICAKRDKFLRPLLNVERSEIESYLNDLNVQWRTDKTNFCDQYFRNKVRLKLISFLNENFPFWQAGLLNASDRYRADGDFIKASLDSFDLNVKDEACKIRLKDYEKLDFALRWRLIIKAANLLGFSERIPFSFIKDLDDCICNDSCDKERRFSKYFSTLEFYCCNDELFIKKSLKEQTDFNFFDIIEEEGQYELPFGLLNVIKSKRGDIRRKLVNLSINQSRDCDFLYDFELPFIIRNVGCDDFIETADGKMKKITDIFKSWHVREQDRNLIPLVVELKGKEQKILAVFASFVGYKDWIVKK